MIEESTLLTASQLRERYTLSYWDSLIATVACETGCTILYSEDMNDGLLINGKVQVVNPFKIA